MDASLVADMYCSGKEPTIETQRMANGDHFAVHPKTLG
jgi:hypothetical protein